MNSRSTVSPVSPRGFGEREWMGYQIVRRTFVPRASERLSRQRAGVVRRRLVTGRRRPFKDRVFSGQMLRHEAQLKHIEIELPFLALDQFQRERGTASVNLTEPLRASARKGEPLHFSTDAHWRPYGSAIAANAIFAALRGQGVL